MSNFMTRRTRWHVIIPIALALLGCSESVPADSNGPPPHLGIREWPVEKSRRVSVCHYTIGFPHGIAQLTDEDRALLAAAAREAPNQSRNRIWLQYNTFTIESDSLNDKRMRLIEHLLASLPQHLTIQRIEFPRGLDVTLPDVLPPDFYASSVDLSVCPPDDDARSDRTPDVPLDTKVPTLVGHARFLVPLEVLPRHYWYDRPFEPLYLWRISFGFDWPDWKNTLSYSGGEETDGMIPDRLRKGVSISLQVPPAGARLPFENVASSPDFDWTVLQNARRGHDTIRVGPFDSDHVIFKATAKGVPPVRGMCDLSPATDEMTDTWPEQLWRRIAQGRCHFDEFPQDDRLLVFISFPGSLLSQWAEVYSRATQKISAMKREASTTSSEATTRNR
jgi:hypothetical protein